MYYGNVFAVQNGKTLMWELRIIQMKIEDALGVERFDTNNEFKIYVGWRLLFYQQMVW